jgi:3-hydroxyisobutyrate dehydrogenase-like beta-hydroxyacid dehydrogenase
MEATMSGVTDVSVGIVGLGSIGSAVAQHILTAGHQVIAWARRPDAMDALVARGGVAARSLSEIGRADVVISVVFDDEGTREVVCGPAGFITVMRPGAVHVAMETISPRLSLELHQAHAERGQRYLAAPVFGRAEAAAKGELAIMCSGSRDAYDAVAPILSTAGHTRWVGPDAAQAMLVKLVGNHMILTMGELLGETFALLRAGGIDGAETKAALLDSLMPSVLARYAQRMVDQPDGRRPANSAIGRKDNDLVRVAAKHLAVELPLADFIGSR